MRLAISVGCPSGIGPEVSVVAAGLATGCRPLLVGDRGAIERAAEARGVAPSRLAHVDEPRFVRGKIAVWQPTDALAERDRAPGRPSVRGGAAQLAWIDAACDLVANGAADALVTGPVSKEAIVRSRAPGSREFLGHTEHLQRRLRAKEVVMAFAAPELITALVTTHLALANVPRAVTARSVATAAYWLGWLVRRLRGARTRVAVASLNPHAVEGGLLGKEESQRIAPGMALARTRLARASITTTLVGPFPAESVFRLAARGEYHGVLAMFHDQATIPMKLLAFGEAVNVSLGLPIVRTSVDHGTAYDRAANFNADARGMREAMALATKLARR